MCYLFQAATFNLLKTCFSLLTNLLKAPHLSAPYAQTSKQWGKGLWGTTLSPSIFLVYSHTHAIFVTENFKEGMHWQCTNLLYCNRWQACQQHWRCSPYSPVVNYSEGWRVTQSLFGLWRWKVIWSYSWIRRKAIQSSQTHFGCQVCSFCRTTFKTGKWA